MENVCCHGNMLYKPLPSKGLFRVNLLPRERVFGELFSSNGLPRLFVAAEKYITEPLPNNGDIRHNIIPTFG
jgi:hypothetical protein